MVKEIDMIFDLIIALIPPSIIVQAKVRELTLVLITYRALYELLACI